MTILRERLPEAQRPGHRVVRTRLFELRFNWRVLGFVAICLAVLFLLANVSMALGAYAISLADVFLVVIGQGTEEQQFVFYELRLPRALTAIMVGAALAISGAIFQGVVRNELASPDIIGINSGAGIIGLAWLLITRDSSVLPFVLFIGALGTATAIYTVSWKGGISPTRLILVGIGLQALLTAFETFLVRRFPVEDIIWADNLLLGSVVSSTWDNVSLLVIGLAVLLPLALLMAWPLRALQLGDDTARTVGLSVEVVRFGIIVVGCWLSALAIAVAGLVGFVALMVPHAARMIAGPMSASVLLFTGALGALLLLSADLVGNHVLPIDLPISVVLGVVGAPYFIFLFWRSEIRI
jgi:iron complex transport system permease protein